MYWMLLPPSANVGRHIEDDSLPHSGYWDDLVSAGWNMIVRLLTTNPK